MCLSAAVGKTFFCFPPLCSALRDENSAAASFFLKKYDALKVFLLSWLGGARLNVCFLTGREKTGASARFLNVWRGQASHNKKKSNTTQVTQKSLILRKSKGRGGAAAVGVNFSTCLSLGAYAKCRFTGNESTFYGPEFAVLITRY